MKKITKKEQKRFLELLLNDQIIVFDMKRGVIEDPCDLCMNGPCLQINIRPSKGDK